MTKILDLIEKEAFRELKKNPREIKIALSKDNFPKREFDSANYFVYGINCVIIESNNDKNYLIDMRKVNWSEGESIEELIVYSDHEAIREIEFTPTKSTEIQHGYSENQLGIINSIGTVVRTENEDYYYKLPQWFIKKDNRYHIVNFDELPKTVKDIELKYGSGTKMFTLTELREAMAYALEWTKDTKKPTPSEYLKQNFGIDLEKL